MARYRLIVAYDGTDFAGWQAQPHENTVANTLQNSFRNVFATSIKIVGASRTDAGVHALGQVAAFSTSLEINPEQMQEAWNRRLPSSIVIRTLQHVSEDYHPQRNVAQKTYWYHFFTKRPLPFMARYGYYFNKKFNEEKLRECLRVFVGTHDFRSFCTGDEYENTVRTIETISLHYNPKWSFYRIEVKGPGFLRYMIRRIVGASLITSSDSIKSPEILEKILGEKNPKQTLFTAPAQGLMLYKISYDTVNL